MDRSVIIIGGGVTGVGIARDLAIRGVETVLLERGEIGGETSTDFHGMLHSGARYAVKDPFAAEKCMQENRTLKEIAPEYIEDTEGFFLKLEQDSEKYFQEKIEACEECGIPAEKINGDEAREIEPELSDDVEKAIKVPDAVIKPVKLLRANLESAKDNGAEIHEHTEVKDIIVEGGEIQELEIESDDGREKIQPGIVVNATGPWTEKTGEIAGIDVSMKPTKGVLTVIENPGLRKVLNRCRPTDSGDIVLPNSSKAVIGTTSQEVEDPDDYEKKSSEEELMLEQAVKMVEEVSEDDLVGSYWGLRPLYDPGDSEKDERDVTREFHLFDHGERDGIENFVSVVGGKWTTYRYMAEKTSDLVCEKLGVDESCKTGEEKLPEMSEIDSYGSDWPPI